MVLAKVSALAAELAAVRSIVPAPTGAAAAAGWPQPLLFLHPSCCSLGCVISDGLVIQQHRHEWELAAGVTEQAACSAGQGKGVRDIGSAV